MIKDVDFVELKEIYLRKGLLSEVDLIHLSSILRPIINHDYWQRISKYPHHNKHNRGRHLLGVTFKAYSKALRKDGVDVTKTAIGAILHDVFDYDWKLPKQKKEKFREKHAFSHPKKALIEAKKHFPNLIDEIVEDIIVKHMWPLGKKPKYKESWIVKWADIYDSIEVLKKPEEILSYIGLKTNLLKIIRSI